MRHPILTFLSLLLYSPIATPQAFGFENRIARYTGDPLFYDEAPLPPSDWEGQGTGTLPYANFVGNYIHDITMLNEQTVWAISTPIDNAAGFFGYDIHAFDNQTAFVTTTINNEVHRLLKTEDGGENGEILRTLSDAFTIIQIEYIENSMGSYMGTSSYNSSTSFTTDDGETWELIDEGFFPDVVRFYDEATGWAVETWVNEGYEPVIYKWVGDAFPQLIVNTNEHTSFKNTIDIFPNPFSEKLIIDLR